MPLRVRHSMVASDCVSGCSFWYQATCCQPCTTTIAATIAVAYVVVAYVVSGFSRTFAPTPCRIICATARLPIAHATVTPAYQGTKYRYDCVSRYAPLAKNRTGKKITNSAKKSVRTRRADHKRYAASVTTLGIAAESGTGRRSEVPILKPPSIGKMLPKISGAAANNCCRLATRAGECAGSTSSEYSSTGEYPTRNPAPADQ